jgi:hypothetical protein
MASRVPWLLPVFLLVACSAGASPSGDEASMTDRPDPVTERTPRPSLVLASSQPVPTPGDRAGEITLTGRLNADSVEGGCVFLETAEGRRYELRWPAGWQVDGRGDLVSPAGEAVARLGGEVTVRGRVIEGMASTCQVGPMFRASEILQP